MQPPIDAFFQAAPGLGQRLYLHHAPAAGRPLLGAIVYVHPWAEEMNKSRRMAALASRALAAEGFAVLQVDLLGCGDSSGDFGDASWEAWIDDVAQAARWLQARHPAAPLWLWGLRAGALLAHAAATRIDTPVHRLYWQPAHQGKAVLQQFLRLKAAARLADGGGKAILEAARAELSAGRPIDVAGYRLPPALAHGLEAAALTPPTAGALAPGRLVWLDVSTQAEPQLSPASQTALARWQEAGWAVHAQAVQGPSFWQTVEIEDAPNLVLATVANLSSAGAVRRSAEPAAPAGAAA